MEIKRRDFIKGCAAASVLFPVGIDSAAKSENAKNGWPSDTDSRIEKSIKASFGGGFSVRAHAQSGGMTYADIEHFDNKFMVVSADLQDWKVIRLSLRKSDVAPFSVSRVSICMA